MRNWIAAIFVFNSRNGRIFERIGIIRYVIRTFPSNSVRLREIASGLQSEVINSDPHLTFADARAASVVTLNATITRSRVDFLAGGKGGQVYLFVHKSTPRAD